MPRSQRSWKLRLIIAIIGLLTALLGASHSKWVIEITVKLGQTAAALWR